jgi:hypothetical protein
MSSIMDELRRLQGRRTPAPSDVAPPTPDAASPLLQAEPVRSRSQVSPRHLVGILVVALAGLIALLVLPTLGRSKETAAGRTTPPDIVLAQAEKHPEAPPEPVSRQKVAPPDAPEAGGGELSAGDAAPAAVFDPAETLQEPAFALAANAIHAAGNEADTALAQADPPDTEEPAVALASFETLTEPRFELASVHLVKDDAQAQTDPATAEDAGPVAEDAGPVAEDAGPVAEDAGPMAEAADDDDGSLEAAVTQPVRVLTEAEDEANKAAIRGLSVRAVFGDETGITVYTSAGPLREGVRFRGMDVVEVTTRSVVFECGNKRYRWCLPNRAERAATTKAGSS